MEYYKKSSPVTIIITFHSKGLIKTIELQEVNDDLRKRLSTSMPSSTQVDRFASTVFRTGVEVYTLFPV